RQTLTVKSQPPLSTPSASQEGSPSMHVCVVSGKPRSTAPLGFTMAHSRTQPPLRRPGMKSTPPFCWARQDALHWLPGAPLADPASHSSPQSTTPLPHTSCAQLGEQPSHGAELPSSQPSPSSRVPLPHT